MRIESWAAYLEDAGWQVDLHPFETEALHDVVYRRGRVLNKSRLMASAFAQQAARIRRLPPADVVFVYREAAMVGPAVLERIAAGSAPAFVYDIDDPVYLRYRSPTNGWASLLKFSGKTRSLIKRATRVIAINEPIARYAQRYNPSTTVISNAIEVTRYERPSETRSHAPVRLLWIGSHTTADNLQTVAEPLARVQVATGAAVRIIGARHVPLAGVTADFRPWASETEAQDLREGHVGLLPLRDTSWNRRKSFFKVLQYMAAGLPVVAQRMESTADLIEHGVNGFLAEAPGEWYEHLRTLVERPDLREQMGGAARATVIERFSLEAQLPKVREVFESAARART